MDYTCSKKTLWFNGMSSKTWMVTLHLNDTALIAWAQNCFYFIVSIKKTHRIHAHWLWWTVTPLIGTAQAFIYNNIRKYENRKCIVCWSIRWRYYIVSRHWAKSRPSMTSLHFRIVYIQCCYCWCCMHATLWWRSELQERKLCKGSRWDCVIRGRVTIESFSERSKNTK